MVLEALTLIGSLDLIFQLLNLQLQLLVVGCHGFFFIQESLKFTVNCINGGGNSEAQVARLPLAWAHTLQQLAVLLTPLGRLHCSVHLGLQPLTVL